MLWASPVSDCFPFELDWRWSECATCGLSTLCLPTYDLPKAHRTHTIRTHANIHSRTYPLFYSAIGAHLRARAHTHVINKGTPKTSQSNLATKLIYPLQHQKNRSAYKHTAARFTFFYLSEVNVATTCQEDRASSCGEEEKQRKRNKK